LDDEWQAILRLLPERREIGAKIMLRAS